MSGTHQNQEVLAHVDGETKTILATIGEEATRQLVIVGRKVDEHGIYWDCPESPGFHVWEGSINTDDAEDIDWTGTWRPARVGDLERFGLRGLESAAGGQS